MTDQNEPLVNVETAETAANATSETSNEKLGFDELVEIYADSIEQISTVNGVPQYRYKSGVDRESLRKRMGLKETAMNTMIPNIKKYLEYGTTLFNYKGNEVVGIDANEPSLMSATGKSRTKFIAWISDELKKPESEREFTVVRQGVQLPDFTGSRGRSTNNAAANVFSKLKGLAETK